MASITELTCPLCSSAAHIKFDYRDFCKHLRLFHAHQPGFKVPCRINGCQRSYTNLRSYQNHVSNVHNWVKDERLVFDEEECLPTNDKLCDNLDDSSDDNNSNDDNDDITQAFLITVIMNNLTKHLTFQVTPRVTLRKCFRNHQLSFCLV